jgi:hypothetical protein
VYFEKAYSVLFLFGKQSYLLLSYYRFYRKFAVVSICFRSRYLIRSEISNKIIGEDRFEGGA